MTTETMSYTYTLIAVYDLREVDEISGKRIPLEEGQGNTCNRCGREHAKVYEVQRDQDAKIFCVGSTCCKKLFGWEPEKEVVNRLTKEAKKRSEDRALQRLEAIATPIATEVNALTIPPVEVIEVREDSRIPKMIWGIKDSSVRVHGTVQDGLTNERYRCLLDGWMREQVRIRLEALYPRTSSVLSEDTNWRRREKIAQAAFKMLELW
jgi:hypothetical protein